jgi:hypothetical protein
MAENRDDEIELEFILSYVRNIPVIFSSFDHRSSIVHNIFLDILA